MPKSSDRVQVSSLSRLRIIKKLAVTAPGARMLHRQFGDPLVCVRHRVDPDAQIRYVTVELLVDSRPIAPVPQPMVAVKLQRHERELQRLVHTAGARWDPKSAVWRMPKRLVGILRLQGRVIPG